MTRWSGVQRALPWCLLLAVSFLESEPSAAPRAETRQEEQGGFQPTAIPLPDSSSLERAVQEQFTSARAFLEEVLRDGDTSPVELSEVFGSTGQLYFAYDFRDAAEACFLNAAGLAPTDFRWLYYLGSLYQAEGRLGEAETYFRRAVAVRPEDLATLIHLAEVHQRQNHMEQAEALFQEALSVGGDAAARAGLGELALLRRNYPEAIEHLEAALALLPEASRLHYLVAMAYRGMGDPVKADWHLARHGPVGVRVPDPLTEELSRLKQGELAHLLRGRLAFRFGRYREAVEAFGKAVRADPNSYRAHVNWASALAELGEVEQAIEEYREALKLSPQGGAAHFNLGYLLAQRGLYEEAIVHLREAVRVEPDDQRGHVELAEALRRTGNLGDALTHYARAAELDPADERARLGGVQMLIEAGAYRSAWEQLEKSHRQYPQHGRTAHALARFLAAGPDPTLRDGARAFDLASLVFDTSPSTLHAETVAMALGQLGRCDEAAEWQEKALREAEGKARPGTARKMQESLVRYRRGPPCQP